MGKFQPEGYFLTALFFSHRWATDTDCSQTGREEAEKG